MSRARISTAAAARVAKSGQYPLRWLAVLAIVLLGVGPLIAVQSGVIAFTRKPSADVVIIIGLMNVAFYLWIRVLSRFSLLRQAIFIVSLVALQLGLYSLVRLEGFAGDGRPLWVWRWSPTAEERFAQSRAGEQQSLVSTASNAADLTVVSPGDSPGFRGIDRTGITAVTIESNWRENPPRMRWRKAVGQGWSSFAVVGDFAVTQEQRGEAEVVVCYRLTDGCEIWAHTENANFFEATSSRGPRATPTIHHGRVYALGATGILQCLDGATGALVWKRDMLLEHQAENRLFGVTGSPLAIGNRIVVAPGGKGSSLAAYDAESGEPAWQAGDAGASYSSPQLVTLASRPQILHFNAEGLTSHAVENGNVLWHVAWISNPAERNDVAQPVVVGRNENRVLVSAAYGMGTGLFEVRERAGEFDVVELWRTLRLQSKFSSVVVADGYVYGLDLGILACIDLTTGKRIWKRGRYGYGQLLLAGSTLLVQLESGDVAMVAARPDRFEELARLDALDQRTWNQPVLAGNRLLLRNDREAICFELTLRDAAIE